MRNLINVKYIIKQKFFIFIFFVSITPISRVPKTVLIWASFPVCAYVDVG